MPDTDYPIFDVSIVIPCFEEENHLKKSVEIVYSIMITTNYKFEFIFVDDCSTDKTRDIIIALSNELPNVRYLFHAKNIGRGGAFANGAKIAFGEYIGFLDIDLEVSPIYLPDILLELKQGYDVVTVSRHYTLIPSPVFILRHILSVGYKVLVSNYLGTPRMDTETGFKFFKREVLFALLEKTENRKWFFDTEIMVLAYRNPYKIKEVYGIFKKNNEKKSTVRLFSDTMDYFIELYKFKKRLKNKFELI